MKISTKIGDKGESRLSNGRILRKSSPVFEVLGDFDEFNSSLGLCKASGLYDDSIQVLEIIQKDLYRIMAIIANDMKIPKGIKELDRKDVLFLEQCIEKFEEEIGDLREFVIPGKSVLSARLHFSRAIGRRAERRLIGYHDEMTVSLGGVPEEILQYMNRVSDLLFLMAHRDDLDKTNSR